MDCELGALVDALQGELATAIADSIVDDFDVSEEGTGGMVDRVNEGWFGGVGTKRMEHRVGQVEGAAETGGQIPGGV